MCRKGYCSCLVTRLRKHLFQNTLRHRLITKIQELVIRGRGERECDFMSLGIDQPQNLPVLFILFNFLFVSFPIFFLNKHELFRSHVYCHYSEVAIYIEDKIPPVEWALIGVSCFLPPAV